MANLTAYVGTTSWKSVTDSETRQIIWFTVFLLLILLLKLHLNPPSL